MNKKIKKSSKISLIVIILIIIFSSSAFAIYKTLTIGNEKLKFNLIVSKENTDPVEVNSPKLVEGMIPIKWNNEISKWVITTTDDSTWYNYNEYVKKWANIMMSDGVYNSSNAVSGTVVDEKNLGSMFVWIPRYEYKIEYNNIDSISSGGTIDINFISTDTIDPTNNGYTIHPAFRAGQKTSYENGEWSSEISGFWMAKFEVSNEIYSSETQSWDTQYISSSDNGDITIDNSQTRLASKPNKESWTHISISKAYTNSKLATYNLDDENAKLINSHLIKNSEWGACAYLSYSKYRKNTQPNINNYMYKREHLITGYAGDSSTSGYYDGNPIDANRYDGQTKGVKASTTDTIYGVYDMNGGTNEFTAAHLIGGTPLDSASAGNEKYYMIYKDGDILTNGKIGDATKETYRWDGNAAGDSSGVKNLTTKQYFMRGGGASNGDTSGHSGLFSYFGTNGDNSSFFRGFRTVLVVE